MTVSADATGDGPGVDEVVGTINPPGAAPILLVCEHASRHIPAAFGDLGLSDEARRSHIAWDPGALAVAEGMAAALDAPLLFQRVSRLVYDCNRPPEAESAVPARSEIYAIPGNEGLSAEARAARVSRYYLPFRAALDDLVDRRTGAGQRPAIVTVHSFTPVYNGVRRTLDIGILHDADARLADAMLAVADAGDVRRNEPYGPEDGVTHTLRTHAIPRGLLNVMIEIRNDLIADPESQRAMAARLSGWVRGALAAIGGNSARIAGGGR